MPELKFDPDVYVIEDDIINHFLSAPIFANRDPLFVRILLLFMTRKDLTQKIIQNITGMSAGKISEEVNHLLDMGLITIANKSDKGKITYSSNSAGMLFVNFTRATINRLVKWEKELLRMKKELEGRKKELEHLNGYKRLYKNIKYYTDITLEYKKFLGIINKYTEDIESQNI